MGVETDRGEERRAERRGRREEWLGEREGNGRTDGRRVGGRETLKGGGSGRRMLREREGGREVER